MFVSFIHIVGGAVVGSFLLLNSILMYKYITDSLSVLLERDFWVVSYDLFDTDYLNY